MIAKILLNAGCKVYNLSEKSQGARKASKGADICYWIAEWLNLPTISSIIRAECKKETMCSSSAPRRIISWWRALSRKYTQKADIRM